MRSRGGTRCEDAVVVAVTASATCTSQTLGLPMAIYAIDPVMMKICTCSFVSKQRGLGVGGNGNGVRRNARVLAELSAEYCMCHAAPKFWPSHLTLTHHTSKAPRPRVLTTIVISAITMPPSPSLGPGAAIPSQIIKFNGYGEFAGLLYHSPHSVVYQDELYPTALHLFEARKFLDHRPQADLADRIRQCERVEQVTAISAELSEFTRRDWGNVALVTVSDLFSFFPLFSAYPRLGFFLFLSFLANRVFRCVLDGRGVVPQVPPARRSTHVAPQHVYVRAHLRRIGRPLLGRWCRCGQERTWQVPHARAWTAARRSGHLREPIRSRGSSPSSNTNEQKLGAITPFVKDNSLASFQQFFSFWFAISTHPPCYLLVLLVVRVYFLVLLLGAFSWRRRDRGLVACTILQPSNHFPCM
jgi:hypothetical protein